MSDEVDILNELQTKLDDLLIEVKEEKTKAFSLNKRKDELEKEIAKLNIIINKLEEQKDMKENPSKLLKPIFKSCIKVYGLAFFALVLFAVIGTSVTIGFSMPLILIIALLPMISGSVDYFYKTKKIRKKIKAINLENVEYALRDNKNRRYEKQEEVNELNQTIKDIWKEIGNKGRIISSLEQEIMYTRRIPKTQSKPKEENKELIKKI
jgi:septal ring factor EnvC (AmiA/AmiB activator)